MNRKNEKTAKAKMGPYWNLEGCRLFRRKKQELGMSFQQLADLVEGKRHALWKWWHGMARPAPRKRKIICDRMGIKHDSWLTAEERKTLRAALVTLNRQKKMTKALSAQRRRTQEALGQC